MGLAFNVRVGVVKADRHIRPGLEADKGGPVIPGRGPDGDALRVREFHRHGMLRLARTQRHLMGMRVRQDKGGVVKQSTGDRQNAPVLHDRLRGAVHIAGDVLVLLVLDHIVREALSGGQRAVERGMSVKVERRLVDREGICSDLLQQYLFRLLQDSAKSDLFFLPDSCRRKAQTLRGKLRL